MSTDLWDDVFLQLIREEGGGREVTGEVEPGNLLHPLLVLLLEQQPRLLMLRLQQIVRLFDISPSSYLIL